MKIGIYLKWISIISVYVFLICLVDVSSASIQGSLVVTSLADSGPGTLREAVAQANATPTDEIIVFEVSGTIVLSEEVIEIGAPRPEGGGDAPEIGNVLIDGANQITITGDNKPTGIDILRGANVTLLNLTFTGSSIGAIYSRGVLRVEGCAFLDNGDNGSGMIGPIDRSGSFGAIAVSQLSNRFDDPYPYYPTLHIVNSIFTSNRGEDGGAVTADVGNLIIENSQFLGNVGGSGGAVNAESDEVIISDSTFIGNFADDDGGAIFGDGRMFVIQNNTFISNTSNGQSEIRGGGAIFMRNGGESDNELTLLNNRFESNTARASGGAVFALAHVNYIANNVFIGNTAQNGGAIASLQGVGVEVSNSTLINNIARENGGGIHSFDLRVINSTLVGNQAGRLGGGVYTYDINNFNGRSVGVITLHNSIIIGSPSGGDCATDNGRVNALNSLIGDGLACVNGENTNNLIGDAGLGVESVAGFLPLLPESPVIDAGDNTLVPTDLLTDQAGAPRVVGGTVDMGAYEYQGE